MRLNDPANRISVSEKKDVVTDDLDPSVVEYLATSDLVKCMTRDEVRELVPHLVSFEVGKGKFLVREDEAGRYMALCVSGQLQVMKRMSHGRQVVISTLSPGQDIGEMSLVDGGPRSATIRASPASMIVALTRDSYLRLGENRPRVALAVLTEVAKELSGKRRRMGDFIADVRGL